jgi:transposase-like protein
MTDEKSSCPLCEEEKSKLHPEGSAWKCPRCGKEYVVVLWDIPESWTKPYNWD